MQASKSQLSDLADALRDVVLAARRKVPGSPHDTATVTLLSHLVALEPLRAGELAERACLDPSTVSRHLRGLEDDGHLARTPDPEDRRATLLQVTESGRELVRSAREQRLTLFGKAIADWNDEDLTTLTELVRRLAQDLENV